MQFHDCNENANRKINPKREAVMQSHTQEGNITTNINVKIDITLPGLSATKIVT